MEFVKNTWMQIRAQLEGLTASQKWLIATLLVLGTLIVGILLTVAGRPEMVSISQFASTRPDEVLARLSSAGIDARKDGSLIRVPKDQEERAILALVEGDLLSDDASAAFDALVGNHSPWATNDQNQRAYLIAKQKVVANIIRRMDGVKSAEVVIDMPSREGFGATYVDPTASVAITTQGRGINHKQMVEAVAALVSGTVAKMSPTDVKVIIDGRMFKVNDVNNMLPSETLEYVHNVEQYHQRKIGELLSYIPGVRVAVNVRVDQVSRKSSEEFEYDRSQPLESEETFESVRRDIVDAGEPGPRSNTGLDIAGSRGRGTEETVTKSLTEFKDKPLIRRTNSVHAGHSVEQINVAINVPRSYFVSYYQRLNPDIEAPPDNAALQPIVADQLAQIQRQVEPMILTAAPGTVVAAMIPDEAFLMTTPRTAPPTGIGSVLVDSNMSKPVGIGLLALLALGLMLMMVRKATQQEVLPSVEELAGVPPRLPSEEELIGEAEELESSLAGVELNESELKSRKIAEQISELIKANPQEAGSILGRWVRHDE